jgi:hypothetical protein
MGNGPPSGGPQGGGMLGSGPPGGMMGSGPPMMGAGPPMMGSGPPMMGAGPPGGMPFGGPPGMPPFGGPRGPFPGGMPPWGMPGGLPPPWMNQVTYLPSATDTDPFFGPYLRNMDNAYLCHLERTVESQWKVLILNQIRRYHYPVAGAYVL